MHSSSKGECGAPLQPSCGGTEIDGKLKKMVAEAVKHQQQMQSAAGH
jgi:hypothetical protein